MRKKKKAVLFLSRSVPLVTQKQQGKGKGTEPSVIVGGGRGGKKKKHFKRTMGLEKKGKMSIINGSQV